MLSKFVREGDRIELTTVDNSILQGSGEATNKVYQSKIYDILSEDTMEILMPMEQTKLLLLPIGGEYNMVFYTKNGLYQCFAKVTDRYKEKNVYILVVEMTSNLRKYQRREYYRFSCVLDMRSRNLEEEEIQALENDEYYELKENLPLKDSVIVDISGGGLRFMSEQKYEPESLIYCSYHLVKGRERKKYEVVGRVLAVRPLDNKPGTYEHRVQFHNIDVRTREEIIRFIFEEERRSLKKD